MLIVDNFTLYRYNFQIMEHKNNEVLARTLPEQIAQHLRWDIMAGRLKPREQLREQEISTRFGVSRGPVREVFRQLSQQGLLITEPNKGVRVASQPSETIRPLIVNLRLQVEIFVLENIFESITEEQIASWDHILSEIQFACQQGDVASLIENDLHFHEAILKAYEDEDIVRLWHPIVLRMMIDYHRHGDLMESYYEHKRILDAIRVGDKEAALAALRDNIQ